jgi:hypothetical protein
VNGVESLPPSLPATASPANSTSSAVSPALGLRRSWPRVLGWLDFVDLGASHAIPLSITTVPVVEGESRPCDVRVPSERSAAAAARRSRPSGRPTDARGDVTCDPTTRRRPVGRHGEISMSLVH